MTQRTFERRLAVDLVVGIVLIILAAAVSLLGPDIARALPGGPVRWALGSVAFLALSLLVACRVGRRLAEAGRLDPSPPRPSVTDAVDALGEMADAVVFDFPREKPWPPLVVLAGGRDDDDIAPPLGSPFGA